MKFLKEEGYHPSHKISIFDRKQIDALLICIAASLALFWVMANSSAQVNTIIFRCMASINLLVITLRVANYLFVQKSFRANYGLPFHLCSYNVLLCFWGAWTMNPAVLDFVFAMSPLAALMALVFPEADAGRYPHFNFRSIEYYYSHTALILTPIIPLIFFGFRPDVSYFPHFAVIFMIMLILAGITNYKVKANYMFLCAGPDKTPLKAVERRLGVSNYRIVLILGFIVLYFIMHFAYYLLTA